MVLRVRRVGGVKGRREGGSTPEPGRVVVDGRASEGRPALVGSRGRGVGTWSSVGANLRWFAAGVGPWRSHALPGRLRHAGGGGGHGVASSVVRPAPSTRPRATTCRGGGALTVHGAAGVQPQAVGQPRAWSGPTVIGTGGPAIVGGARVITWRSILAKGVAALLVGAMVHGTPWGWVRSHGWCRLLGAKLGPRGAALHGGRETSVLSHGRLGGMRTNI